MWITINYGKFLKRWEYQTTLPVSWETCIQIKKQQLEQDIEQQTGSKLGKECVKTVCCHSVYLTYVQSTSCEMLGWMNHKLEPRLKYQQPQICRWYHSNGRSKEKLKNLLIKVKEWKSLLKTQHSKSYGIWSHHFIANRWGKSENNDRFSFLGSKITEDTDCRNEIKRHLLFGRRAMTNLDGTLKNKDITLPTKIHIVKAMVFPVVTHGCESLTIEKAGSQTIDAFKPGSWRGLLRVHWTARRSD